MRSKCGRAIVTEGYMDVIRLAQAGFVGSVAALGTAVTSAHVSALFKAADHVIFAFDGDAGRKAARRALETALPVIADTKRASFVSLPKRPRNPDSVIGNGTAAFDSALSEALPLSEFSSGR